MAKVRRYSSLLLALTVWLVWAVSCTPGFSAPSDVDTLRILSVVADKPYAAPGDDITFEMTVFDGLGDPADPASGPRTLQLVWIAGCVDPPGDQYFLCFQQLADIFGNLAEGQMPPPELFKADISAPTNSGVPNAHSFTTKLPDDIISRRPPPSTGPHYGIAYVFFAACAGKLSPTPLSSLGGAVPEFPLRCLDAAGNKLGSDSFVVGYTQVYAFADQRHNANPTIGNILLDGQPIADDFGQIPSVQRCPVSEQERLAGGCGSDDPTAACQRYTIKAEIADIAEDDPSTVGEDGRPLKESVWVSYFTNAGDMDAPLVLVSDAVEGYLGGEHETGWLPPAEPGIATLWAVVRDQRGGSALVRRFVRVE